MAKKLYLSPAIRVRSLEIERLLDGGSITNINDGGSGDGLGYGGEGGGPAYAPRWGNLWDDSEDPEFSEVWSVE